MKQTLIATYERESTLWKNANAFYHMQDWTLMECIACDFSEDIADCEELGVTFLKNGVDVTDEEMEDSDPVSMSQQCADLVAQVN